VFEKITDVILTLWRPLCRPIKHPVPGQVKQSFVIFHNFDIWALWRSTLIEGRAWECLDVKNNKWLLNLVWHRMIYSCTHMATVGIKGLITLFQARSRMLFWRARRRFRRWTETLTRRSRRCSLLSMIWRARSPRCSSTLTGNYDQSGTVSTTPSAFHLSTLISLRDLLTDPC